VFAPLFLTVNVCPLFADAYLAEDKIYYGADSYSINYDDEIITARGHAFFRRGDVTVYARKIVIHYADREKHAFLYREVRVENSAQNFTITGDYGEARYLEEYYFVEGNGKFRDSERSIEAVKIESEGWKQYTFSESVVYTGRDIRVTAQTLRVDERNIAHFDGNVHTVFLDSGDEIYCEKIRYFSDTGSSEFHGDVLYIQKENEDRKHTLVVRSDIMRYDSDSQMLILIKDVYMMNGEYTVYAPLARYDMEKGLFRTMGDTIVRKDRDTVYCKGLVSEVGSVELTGSIQGVFGRRGAR